MSEPPRLVRVAGLTCFSFSCAGGFAEGALKIGREGEKRAGAHQQLLEVAVSFLQIFIGSQTEEKKEQTQNQLTSIPPHSMLLKRTRRTDSASLSFPTNSYFSPLRGEPTDLAATT